MTQIKFGTSGWRGILAEDFTLDNVRVVVRPGDRSRQPVLR